MTLVERARKLLDGHPAAIEGSGGNRTTFAAACALVWGFGFTPEEAMPLMLEYNARCEPPWSQRELERMLRGVLTRTQHKEPRGHFVTGDAEKGAMEIYGQPEKRIPRKKEHDLAKLKELQDRTLPSDYAGWRHWLRMRSPIDPREVDPIAYLDELYRPGEKILIFEKMWGSQGDYGRVIGERTVRLARTPNEKNKRLELPKESAEGLTYLMQPVDGQWHPVERNGRVELSRRTKQSVTRWPYILLESDKVPFELWLNCLVRMKIRVVSITHSGGRSLHALVRLDKDTEEELQAEIQDEGVRETLAILGTDTQAMQSLVYPRLPNTMRKGKRMSKRDPVTKEVVRKNGKAVMEFVPFRDGPAKQALLYFNPAAEIGRSIAEGVTFERP